MQVHKLSGQIAVQDLARRIAALPTGGGRRLVAVAGVPASGKSMLAGAVVGALNETGHPVACPFRAGQGCRKRSCIRFR